MRLVPIGMTAAAAVAGGAIFLAATGASAGATHDDADALAQIASAQAALSAAADDLTAPPPTVTETATVTPSPVTVTATATATATTTVTSTVTATPDPAAISAWGSPVWSDEFDGTAVDPAKWTVADGTTANGMLERRMAGNVTEGSGQLALTAKRETSGTKSYTSGYISTEGKPHATGPGTLTLIRAQFPTDQDAGRGMWSALWFRSDQGPGEIDLVEAYSNKPDLPNAWRSVVITLHSDTCGKTCGDVKRSFTVTFPTGTLPQQMHTYGVEILPDRFRFTVDGTVVWEPTIAANPAYASMMDDTWRTIVNQQISAASTYFYAPDAGTVFPRQMLVDYVRVYRKG